MVKIKKHTFKASIVTFVVYPIIGLTLTIVNLFQNKSIHFFGYNLLLEEGENFVRASLDFKWYFILTFLFIFVVIWVLDFGISKLTINSHQ